MKQPRLRLLLAILAVGATVDSTDAKELYERDWLEARSPNFRIFSALKEQQTRTVVQELEDFRQVVGIFTNASILEPRVPTYLFIFPGPVAEIGLKDPVAGFFVPELRANYAVVRNISGQPISLFIQHEYTHFVVRNQSHMAYPRWYDEGIAEVLGTVNLRDGEFDFGNADQGRLAALGDGVWLKYPRLIDDAQVTKLSERELYMYYAQSWALVHYLTWGRTNSKFTSQLQAYLAIREAGTSPVPAFEQAFEEDADQLNNNVRRYLFKAKYGRGKLKAPFDPGLISVRRMSLDETAAALGNLYIVTGNSDEASRYVKAALAANSSNARALVDLADLYKFEEKFDEAKPLYERAIALEPTKDEHHLDFGEYWLDLVTATADTTKRREYLSLARRELVQAYKLNDANPETLTAYGGSFLLEGEDPTKAIDTLELAHELLPSQPQIKFNLAMGYVSVGRATEARQLLLAMRAWSHKDTTDAVDKLLQEIDKTDTGEDTPQSPTGTP